MTEKYCVLLKCCTIVALFPPFRIGNPQAIYPNAYQYAMLDPSPPGCPLRSSLSDPYPFRLSLGSEPVTEYPPHSFYPTAAGFKPDATRHDHSPAHHGYIHHHRNHIVTGHGQSSWAQFHQRGQLSLVIILNCLECHIAPADHCCF